MKPDDWRQSECTGPSTFKDLPLPYLALWDNVSYFVCVPTTGWTLALSAIVTGEEALVDDFFAWPIVDSLIRRVRMVRKSPLSGQVTDL